MTSSTGSESSDWPREFASVNWKDLTPQEAQELLASLHHLREKERRERSHHLRHSFRDFVKEFWECIPGAGSLTWNWHLDVFCDELQSLAEGVFANRPRPYDLAVNVSPGTSKSSVFSILFHPWTWTRMPQARHLYASHTEDLVLDLAYKAREVIRSEKYHDYFPEVELRQDQDAKGLYRNTAGGDRRAATVGGKTPMGFHAHFLGIDDPLDPKKAVSELELQTARDFVTNIIPTRKVDKRVSVTFVVHQRLHREDTTAVMLENAGKEGAIPVRHVCLPAELTEHVSPPELREKYADGLMDPVRLPRDVLRNAEVTQGRYWYHAQFLQSPVPLGGGMFREHYFNQRVRAAPYNSRRLRYWDRAATADGGCYTAGVLLAKDSLGNYYVEHVVHGQWEPTERNKVMRATALRDRARYGPRHEPAVYVEMEGGSSGRDAWKGVVKALEGFAVREDRVTGSKDVRAEPLSTQFAAGNVYLVDGGESEGTGRADWDVKGYVQEFVLFKPEPGKKRLGKYADQVDATSGAFNLLTGSVMNTSSFQVRRLRPRDKGPLLVVLSREELETFTPEGKCLLVSVQDPLPVPVLTSPVPGEGGDGGESTTTRDEIPSHGLKDLVGSLVLRFADLAPEECGTAPDDWDRPVPPWNLPTSQLMMDKASGKRLWSFLLRKREFPAAVVVLQDEGTSDRRAYSLARGISEILRLHPPTLQVGPDPEGSRAGHDPGAVNAHVLETVKACRHAVVG